MSACETHRRKLCYLDEMTSYRRNFFPGGSFFFTVNLVDRKLSLLTTHVELLRVAFRETRQRHPFTIDAIVILPDHLHAIWTMPDGDANFATRWRLIKSTFSRKLVRNELVSASRASKGERGIWQRRFWEHLIRDDGDYRRHVEYCYINPVKHGLVKRVRDWPFSSFHRDVASGLFPEDWAGDFGSDGEFGESEAAQ